ncbi:sigma-54-dependent transcriptional regulator [Roseiterribacter gracilis]|uniref:Sigma-54-dependent Fis family transcriptional regulator n=1 Tax=Roseiterribacter gracilis TaxID=2812848 RepID=A0A8S8XEH4_9PROT|nr:sigma-54-dependent Fis family transcriptional regulator [Rhodospirillales bacterium TMPK1]
MPQTDAPILLIEDTPALARLYQEYLAKTQRRVAHVETGAEALAALDAMKPQLVLLDLKLPDMDGMSVLQAVKTKSPETAVVVITANGSVNVAVEAMKAGADDFLVKPFTAERLVVTVTNALDLSTLKRKVDHYERNRYHGFLGSSMAMQAVYRIIESAAASKATVFITGESGTGKEVAAEAIHAQSPRAKRPFVPLNCGAIPRDLMESEIFGHVKGAFTGAVVDRDGAARLADGGTLFLDEICELDINLQTKLLRFLQTGSYVAVGGTKTERVDIRVVCATNRDPLKEVEAGRFREDLYYRLHVIPLQLPPLRERGEDALEIASALLAEYTREEKKRFVGFDPDIERLLLQYDWPGNVRQVQNVIRNIVVLHDGAVVSAEMLPEPLKGLLSPSNATTPNTGWRQPMRPEIIRPLAEIEREMIERAINACGGSIPKAAELLAVAPSTIYRKKQVWEAEDAGQQLAS